MGFCQEMWSLCKDLYRFGEEAVRRRGSIVYLNGVTAGKGTEKSWLFIFKPDSSR